MRQAVWASTQIQCDTNCRMNRSGAVGAPSGAGDSAPLEGGPARARQHLVHAISATAAAQSACKTTQRMLLLQAAFWQGCRPGLHPTGSQAYTPIQALPCRVPDRAAHRAGQMKAPANDA